MLLSLRLPALSSAILPRSCNVNRRPSQSSKSPASIAFRITPYRATSSFRRNTESSPNAASVDEPSPVTSNGDGGGEEFRVLTATRSEYNHIVILEDRESRILLLDESRSIHSIFYKQQKWTNAYWDEFVTLPAIVPEGPIAIFGLGGGTAAYLLLQSWPSLELYGWELDEILIDKAREYFQVSDLENYTDAGGILHIKIGDALSSSSDIPGGYAGIIVDLFSDGKILPFLEKADTWQELRKKLMPNGRIMVNCAGSDSGMPDEVNMIHQSKILSADTDWLSNSTIKAINTAFDGLVNWKTTPDGLNYLALTGPLPDLNSWADSVPSELSYTLKQWNPCVHLR